MKHSSGVLQSFSTFKFVDHHRLMATTEALTEGHESEDDTLDIVDSLKEIQRKSRRRFLCRCCSAILILAMIIAIFVLLYPTMASGCGSGDAVCGDASIMESKSHGTCVDTVQDPLRWNCDRDTADRICCFNRKYAEHSGYWKTTTFLQEVNRDNITTFYDSVTGKALFKAPQGRTFDDFKTESEKHGWPSFRDQEVVWDNVRVLADGETVSVDGTHLGHNLPDFSGNRYCINLVSVAGNPVKSEL